MKKPNLELRVGVFVVIALAALTVLVIRSGDFYLKPGYPVRFLFDYVAGIDQGSPVKLAGVPIGEVTDIRVIRDEGNKTQVEVIARVAPGAYISDDAEVRINSSGLLGEKYVEILPGVGAGHSLSEGGALMGKKPVVFERITESGERLINKMEFTVDNLNQVLADPGFKTSVKDTFGDASVVAKNFKESSEDMKDTIKSAKIVMGRLRDGEGTVGRLMKDETIARDLEAFVKDVKAHPWKLLKRD